MRSKIVLGIDHDLVIGLSTKYSYQGEFIKSEESTAVGKNICIICLEKVQPATLTKIIENTCDKIKMNVESTEEEIVVFAEFSEPINFDKYNNIHVLGIDTQNPIIQLDDTFFTGTFENPLGTYMFFEEDSLAECEDPLFDKLPEKNLKFLEKTRKLIRVEHAYVTPKEKQQPGLEEEVQKTSSDIQPAEFKNIQDGLEKFKKEWKNKIVNE